jgi:hypothetical protein
MKHLFPIFPVLTLLATCPVWGQPTGLSPNDGLGILRDPVEESSLLSWWGIHDRFYFVQESEDLVKWNFLPFFDRGSDDELAWGLKSTAPALFFRVLHTADPESGLMTADYDEDGLTTYEEYLLGANPFNPDTSGDGIFDGIALKLGLSVTPPEIPATNPLDLTPPVITLTSPASAVLIP